MDQRRKALARPDAHEETSTPLGLGWSLHLTREREGGAVVRVRRQDEVAVELTIRITSEGPVLRARGRTLELEATHEIHASCEHFSVDATKGIDLRSSGDLNQIAQRNMRLEGAEVAVRATRGDVRVKANDDVQLKGEGILLNCDRPEPVPVWTGVKDETENRGLPTKMISGDPSLVAIKD